jgi:hypothetical protein
MRYDEGHRLIGLAEAVADGDLALLDAAVLDRIDTDAAEQRAKAISGDGIEVAFPVSLRRLTP